MINSCGGAVSLIVSDGESINLHYYVNLEKPFSPGEATYHRSVQHLDGVDRIIDIDGHAGWVATNYFSYVNYFLRLRDQAHPFQCH
jgi:hypothetical protein